MIQYNIILNDDDYVPAWDKFSDFVSNKWDWEDDSTSSADYKKFFDKEILSEGIIATTEESVTFSSPAELTMFLLKWS